VHIWEACDTVSLLQTACLRKAVWCCLLYKGSCHTAAVTVPLPLRHYRGYLANKDLCSGELACILIDYCDSNSDWLIDWVYDYCNSVDWRCSIARNGDAYSTATTPGLSSTENKCYAHNTMLCAYLIYIQKCLELQRILIYLQCVG